MNRAGRRAALQLQKNSVIRYANHRPERQYEGPIWSGRCQCDCDSKHCGGRYPETYLLPVKAFKKGKRPETLLISYDCFQNSMAPPDNTKVRAFHDDTIESCSAAGLRWLEDLFHAGTSPDLHESTIESEDDVSLRREIALMSSLAAHLANREDLNEVERAAKLRRCRDLMSMHAGNDLRLAQWLAREFPEWATQ